MKPYVDMLGIAFIAYGLMQIVLLGVVLVLLGGGSAFIAMLGAQSGDTELMMVGGLYGAVITVALGFSALLAVPNLFVGAAIRRRAPWARIGAIVMGCMSLMNMPLGTILGAFALVTMLDAEVSEEFKKA